MKKEEKILADFTLLIEKKRALGVRIVESLIDISRDNLHLKFGHPTLFSFLTERFHFSESEAYKKIQAARLARKYPEILKYLKMGSLNLSGVSVLSSTLLMENCPFAGSELIGKSLGQNKRSIEVMIKDLWQNYKNQQAAVPSDTWLLPQEVGSNDKKLEALPSPKPKLPNLTPKEEKKVERLLKNYRLNITLDDKQLQDWQQIKVQLSRKHPQGLNDQRIFEELLKFYLDHQKKKDGRTYKIIKEKLNPKNRYISSSLKKFVWKRDQGKCQFVGDNGQKCAHNWNVQYDHITPYGVGGGHTKQNLRLLCGNHHRKLSQEARTIIL